MSFEVGEIVKLKSGGPDMTVERDRTLYDHETSGMPDKTACVWFSENAGPFRDTFHKDLLEYVDGKNPE